MTTVRDGRSVSNPTANQTSQPQHTYTHIMASGFLCGGALGGMLTGKSSSVPSLALSSSRTRGNIHRRSLRMVANASGAAGAGSAAGGDSSDSFSGEWPMAWSLASYEDLGEYYEKQVLKEEGMGGHFLADVMSTELYTTKPEDEVASLTELFKDHTGLPVLDGEGRLIGVISKRDIQDKPPTTTVAECMSSPPIAAKPSMTVADAACLMLKHKIHRVPIVDKTAKVIGMVTRTDIFTALEAETSLA